MDQPIDEKEPIVSAEDPKSSSDESILADRILNELERSGDMYGSSRDRLPPAWQIVGALILLIALSSLVISAGNPDANWHERFLTGFMDGVLVFLGDLAGGLHQFWDVAFPGKGFYVMTGVTAGVTVVNLGLMMVSIGRHRRRHAERSTS